MPEAITIEVSGLKCDAPQCDYFDHEAKYEDYEKYVNKPCPKCGANLLTEADMKACQLMRAAAELVNNHIGEVDGERVYVNMGMDGSGKITPTIIPSRDSE